MQAEQQLALRAALALAQASPPASPQDEPALSRA